ncbi:DNA helicase [Ranunculus cassubicifolius]
MSIILVGDMRQLPPVCDSSLYLDHGSHMLQEGGKAYASFNKCIRLSHIFRQSGDDQATFRAALVRLSNGTSTFCDWELFKTRDLSLLRAEEANKFSLALRLFPTRDSATDYNLSRLIELGKPCAQIRSKDNCETASRADAEEAKGLEKVLYLSVGARVMLRTNLATNYGLVNGAMGIVDSIVYGQGCRTPVDMPVEVMVNFDNYNGPAYKEGTRIIPITPHTTHWKTTSGTTCSRTQLPLMLCWAITIHKSQGLTLDQAVVDIGRKESLGLTFVALSRTRKLEDLAFNPMFTYERLLKIKECSGLPLRMLEEERLSYMSNPNA